LPFGAAGRRRIDVVDVLGQLGGDLARRVGTDAGDQRGRDPCASLKEVLRGRAVTRRDGPPIRGTVEKCELAIPALSAWPAAAQGQDLRGPPTASNRGLV